MLIELLVFVEMPRGNELNTVLDAQPYRLVGREVVMYSMNGCDSLFMPGGWLEVR